MPRNGLDLANPHGIISYWSGVLDTPTQSASAQQTTRTWDQPLQPQAYYSEPQARKYALFSPNPRIICRHSEPDDLLVIGTSTWPEETLSVAPYMGPLVRNLDAGIEAFQEVFNECNPDGGEGTPFPTHHYSLLVAPFPFPESNNMISFQLLMWSSTQPFSGISLFIEAGSQTWGQHTSLVNAPSFIAFLK